MNHLVLSGSPRERGLLHGKTFAKEIHDFAKIRKDLLSNVFKSWTKEKFSKLVELHLQVLKKDHEIWEEFAAIAEAAQISHKDLMVLNNHTDLRDFIAGQIDETFFECSCFVIKKGTQILAGQTWDMHASAKPYVLHLTVKKGNQTQEIFTLTGCLGLTGVTSSGFGVFINNLRSTELGIGYAWPATVRKLLDCTSLDEAPNVLRSFLPSAGRNFLLVDKKEASCFEVTGKNIERIGDLSKGFLFHTNHYLSSLKVKEEENARSKTTFDRYAYLSEHIPRIASGEITVKNICEEIFNKSLGILSLAPPKDPHGSATCGGLVYDFTSKEGISFEGLYSEKNFISFKC